MTMSEIQTKKICSLEFHDVREEVTLWSVLWSLMCLYFGHITIVASKVDEINSISFLNWTPIFGFYQRDKLSPKVLHPSIPS